MKNQMIFKRYELKYLMTRRQKEQLLRQMEPHMSPDEYARSSVRSIYYDTPDHRLIRQSIDSTVYKEKLRLRSYGRPEESDEVFIELKKKYRDVVYKRRISLPCGQAEACLDGREALPDSQIGGEIAYTLGFYVLLQPALFLSYDREAFRASDDGDLRVTFDENIRCRQQELCLGSLPWGTPLLDRDMVLMELKTPDAVPLWMVRALSEQGLYRCSFSKYGTAYRNIIFENGKEQRRYA